MFGKRLKELREDNDLTQKEVACKIGIGIRTYQKYETEEIEPKLSALQFLANYYECTLDYIIGRTEHPKEGIAEFSIKGHNTKIGYDKDIFPNGITEEGFMKLLKEKYDLKSNEIAKSILEELTKPKNRP